MFVRSVVVTSPSRSAGMLGLARCGAVSGCRGCSADPRGSLHSIANEV